jgi:hypothetical protein
VTRPGPDFDKTAVEAGLAVLIAGLAAREWTQAGHRMRLGGEDYTTLADRTEDGTVVLVRDSDGLRLECELWVRVFPAGPPDIRPTDDVAVEGGLL